jgi:hypothetical protein
VVVLVEAGTFHVHLDAEDNQQESWAFPWESIQSAVPSSWPDVPCNVDGDDGEKEAHGGVEEVLLELNDAYGVAVPIVRLPWERELVDDERTRQKEAVGRAFFHYHRVLCPSKLRLPHA